MSHGSLYDLVVTETEFRAAGMHDSLAIEKAVRNAIEQTLREHPLVLSLERPPIVDMKASPKNFAPARNTGSRPRYEGDRMSVRVETEQAVEDLMAYIHDFYEANDEWPTRKEYANFLGLDNARAIPGVRAAINRKLVGYLWPHDRMAPRDVAAAQYEAWAAEHNTTTGPDA